MFCFSLFLQTNFLLHNLMPDFFKTFSWPRHPFSGVRITNHFVKGKDTVKTHLLNCWHFNNMTTRTVSERFLVFQTIRLFIQTKHSNWWTFNTTKNSRFFLDFFPFSILYKKLYEAPPYTETVISSRTYSCFKYYAIYCL